MRACVGGWGTAVPEKLVTNAEMEQRVESHNPPETDRMEELIVNPIVLEATRRRGNLDLDGVRYVIIRYGKQFQAIFPFAEGHVSVGIEASADAVAVSEKVVETLRRAGGPTG